MSVSLLAQRYATALAGAAVSSGALETVAGDMQTLGQALTVSDELGRALESPQVPATIKAAILRGIFRDPPHEVTEAFIQLITDRGRAGYLAAMVEACAEAIDRRSGFAVADVHTAIALTDEQQESLRARLSSFSGAKVRLSVRLEPELKGGLMVRLADTIIDGTVGSLLQGLHRRLCGSPAPSTSV